MREEEDEEGNHTITLLKPARRRMGRNLLISGGQGNGDSHISPAFPLPLAFPAQPFRYIKNSLLRRQNGTTGWMEHRPRFGGVQRSDRERPSELLREANPKPTSGHLSRDGKTIRANTRRPKAPSDSKVKKEDAKRAEVKIPFRPLDTYLVKANSSKATSGHRRPDENSTSRSEGAKPREEKSKTITQNSFNEMVQNHWFSIGFKHIHNFDAFLQT